MTNVRLLFVLTERRHSLGLQTPMLISIGSFDGFQRVLGGEIKTYDADFRASRDVHSLKQFLVGAAEASAPVRPAQWAAQVDSVTASHADLAVQAYGLPQEFDD